MKYIEGNNKKGFTLIELMVTVVIVGVLMVGAVVIFSGANKKARDSRRKADLEKVRIALEMYKQVGGSYPANTGFLVPDYLQSWPDDPMPDRYRYVYGVGNPATTYVLEAYLEGEAAAGGGSDCGLTATVYCNYSLTNP